MEGTEAPEYTLESNHSTSLANRATSERVT